RVWANARRNGGRVLAVVHVDSARLAGRLAKALAKAGLHPPAITVRIVDHLERDPETGKLRRFVPLPAAPDRTDHRANAPGTVARPLPPPPRRSAACPEPP